jgi:hypothetical protein
VKKFVLPVGAGVVVFGVVTAFAASLNVSSDSLGAGNATVAACQSAAHVTYSTTGTTVDSADVTFSGGAVGDECDGLSAEVTLSGTNSLSAAATATVANAVASADFSSANVNAEDVTDVSVVISG